MISAAVSRVGFIPWTSQLSPLSVSFKRARWISPLEIAAFSSFGTFPSLEPSKEWKSAANVAQFILSVLPELREFQLPILNLCKLSTKLLRQNAINKKQCKSHFNSKIIGVHWLQLLTFVVQKCQNGSHYLHSSWNGHPSLNCLQLVAVGRIGVMCNEMTSIQ